MNSYQKSLNFCKLPIAIAISSVILVGCGSTKPTSVNPRVSNLPNNTANRNISTNIPPRSTTRRTTPKTAVSRSKASQTWEVSSEPASESYSTALLDDESLEELADLLEATDMAMVEDDQLAIQHYGNLWDRLRAGFSISNKDYKYNPRIEAQKSWFTARQDYINRLTARASRYLYHTVSEAERRNIPTELALLPVIESSYDPTATSNASAAGLWQFIPSTGRIYGLTQTSSYDGRRDVIESTRAAYDFLTVLYNQFGSWELALAAYNAGPGRVQRAIDSNESRGLATDFWSLKLPTETRNYVPRFLAVAQIVADANNYNVYFPAIANRQHFRSVPVNYGVTLNEVSRYTGVGYDELRMLNPSLISARVDAAGPNRIIIPNDVNMSADAKLSQLAGNGEYLPNVPDAQYEALSQSSEGLAEFATRARVPQQNSEYIAPKTPTTYSEPPLRASEIQAIESELKKANTLPTTSARVTSNATITQEPPLTEAEKRYIAEQIKNQTPEVKEVVSAVDGNVKLEAIQTQQSVLDSKGQDKRLSFAAPAAIAKASKPAKPKPKGKRTVYTVRRGDTLTGIAARAGLSWRDIADWNQINASETLLAGSKLYLYGAKSMSASRSTLNKSSKNSGVKKQSYTVRRGDTLVGTANRFGMTVSQLASYNNIPTNTELQVGQKLWVVAGKTPTRKSTSNKSSATKSVTYKVKSGETLIGLANQFNVTVNSLARANNLTTKTQLMVGQTLKVPKGGRVPKTSSRTSSAPSYNGSYTVRAGDTLSGVARKFGVSTVDLAAANRLTNKSQLKVKQKLNVPAKSGGATKSNRSSVKTSGNYKVKSGDSLIKLAKKNGLSVKQLANANGLSSKAKLTIGQRITIPRTYKTYKVKSGDTLIGLAKKHGMTTAQLAKLNRISSKAKLKKGQSLKVPY